LSRPPAISGDEGQRCPQARDEPRRRDYADATPAFSVATAARPSVTPDTACQLPLPLCYGDFPAFISPLDAQAFSPSPSPISAPCHFVIAATFQAAAALPRFSCAAIAATPCHTLLLPTDAERHIITLIFAIDADRLFSFSRALPLRLHLPPKFSFTFRQIFAFLSASPIAFRHHYFIGFDAFLPSLRFHFIVDIFFLFSLFECEVSRAERRCKDVFATCHYVRMIPTHPPPDAFSTDFHAPIFEHISASR
jgi:hypothetical protein